MNDSIKKYSQAIPPERRYSLADFRRDFPDNDACLEHVKNERWPNGISLCAKCGKDRKHHRVSGRTAYACDYCGNHIYPLAGTIFEHSSTELWKWFYAMYLIASTRCGISAKQLQRELSVTYKCAWRMFRQIRTLLHEDIKLEGSSIEVDETYHGGVRKYGTGRPMRGDKKKTPVMGMVERGGRIVALALDDVKGSTLLGNIRKYVMPASTVFTDELPSYDGITHMPEMGYVHRRIKHSAGVYVRGDVHTNTIEGFWSLVKRGIGGVYHSVSQKYLQSYLDEYSFRYNRRENDEPMFKSVLRRVSEVCQEAVKLPVLPVVEIPNA
jgi:transposase